MSPGGPEGGAGLGAVSSRRGSVDAIGKYYPQILQRGGVHRRALEPKIELRRDGRSVAEGGGCSGEFKPAEQKVSPALGKNLSLFLSVNSLVRLIVGDSSLPVFRMGEWKGLKFAPGGKPKRQFRSAGSAGANLFAVLEAGLGTAWS